MKSSDLFDISQSAQKAMVDLVEKSKVVIEARFKDQPDEVKAAYLSNVKAGVTRTYESLSDLVRLCDVATSLWRMGEELEECLQATCRQYEELSTREE